MEPLWESRTDHMIMYQLAQKLGFDKELVKNYKMVQGQGRHGRAENPSRSFARSTSPSGPSATPARARSA